MKKNTLIIAALLVVTLGSAFAEDVYMSAFSPRSATILAQGGSFTAVARGYEALYTNPAAFASRKGKPHPHAEPLGIWQSPGSPHFRRCHGSPLGLYGPLYYL